NHLVKGQSRRPWPAKTVDAQAESVSGQSLDRLAAVAVWLADKADLYVFVTCDRPIQFMVAGPLTLDDAIAQPDAAVFRDCRRIRGNGKVEMRGNKTRVVVETPVIVAKPIDRGGARLAANTCDYLHRRVMIRVKQNGN